MEFYAIAPHGLMEMIREFDRYLVVAPFLRLTDKSEERRFFINRRREGAQVILDNGAYELGEAMPDSEFIKIALEIKPQWIVLPDVFRDAQKTIERSAQFLDLLEEQGLLTKFSYMGVPQGKTIMEWVRCYNELILSCDRIGLPCAQWKDITGKVREFLVKNLDGLKVPDFHLLGLWNPQELEWYKHSPRVKSIDTSLPFKYAQRGFDLRAEQGRIIADWKLDFDRKMSEQEVELAEKNLQEMKRLCDE